MARDREFYLNAALERFNAGLDCEARRKEVLADLNRAYDLAHDDLQRACLDSRVIENGEIVSDMSEAANSVYWDLPSYPHQWKPKHAEMVRAAFGEGFEPLLREIEGIVALRAEIKAAPVNPAPVREVSPYEVKVRAKLEDIRAKRKADYLEAIELGEIFGGLPVSCNAHIVHGHKGAVFWRRFFYLRGRLVALNVIIAAAQKLERRKEEVQ